MRDIIDFSICKVVKACGEETLQELIDQMQLQMRESYIAKWYDIKISNGDRKVYVVLFGQGIEK